MADTPAEPRTIEGDLDATGMKFAIVAARFNDYVVDRLITGARETLERLGVPGGAVTVVRVPGSFEIPPMARRLAHSGGFDAVICLGAVIRGATAHFEYVAGEAARGVAQVAFKADIPVIFGILTTDTVVQAVDRAGAKAGNKGSEAAMAAVEMASLYRKMAGEAAPPARPRRPANRRTRRAPGRRA